MRIHADLRAERSGEVIYNKCKSKKPLESIASKISFLNLNFFKEDHTNGYELKTRAGDLAAGSDALEDETLNVTSTTPLR